MGDLLGAPRVTRLVWTAALVSLPALVSAQPNSSVPAREQRDGQRDFDFEIGRWTTHLRRLARPLSGSKSWVEYTGTSIVRTLVDGRSNVVELDVEGAQGRIQGLSLRLYNPDARQWSLNFSSAR